MVVLLDLTDDGEADEPNEHEALALAEETRPNPNINGFSAAVGCYPIISQLASSLDLNSLHELSRTCRQIRVNLLQYRAQLISHTLRCENENNGPGPRLADRLREAHAEWNTFGANGVRIGRITSGKVGACARDLVGDCRRCGRIVCRNCIMKHPASTTLKNRFRRLCRTCIKSPLEKHTCMVTTNGTSQDVDSLDAFASQAFARGPCTCSNSVWICQPCGQTLRSADVTYVRGWTWRTRYSTYLGGLGTGIGEGTEGVECGRRSNCLDAKEVEKEIDCDADELAALKTETEQAEREGRTWSGTSYFTQEIDGIGGVVKKKVKKRVRVGLVVKEYEDERDHGNYLSREQNGEARSWCSWCERVVPSRKDVDGAGHDTLNRVISASSSVSSR